jgi:hypothetical protein
VRLGQDREPFRIATTARQRLIATAREAKEERDERERDETGAPKRGAMHGSTVGELCLVVFVSR